MIDKEYQPQSRGDAEIILTASIAAKNANSATLYYGF
jgi:hypothetical protein